MRRILLAFCFILPFLASHAARAGNGAEIITGIIGFAADQIQREEQRQAQERYHQRLHQQFLSAWRACFRDDILSCDQALTYPYLNATDRTRLISKRMGIIAEAHEAQERAERARITAERERANRRAEADRMRRERKREEQRLAELRTYAILRDTCFRYDIPSCNRAILSTHATTVDLVEMRRWRGIAERYRSDRHSCKTGKLTACDTALASPALVSGDRQQLEQWRTDAAPVTAALASALGSFASLADLPIYTQISYAITLLLFLTLAAIAYRKRAIISDNPTDPIAAVDTSREPSNKNTAAIRIKALWARALRYAGHLQESIIKRTTAPQPDAAQEQQTAPSPPVTERDTPGAIAALELAHAYITEVTGAPRPAHDDKVPRRDQLNALSCHQAA